MKKIIEEMLVNNTKKVIIDKILKGCVKAVENNRFNWSNNSYARSNTYL